MSSGTPSPGLTAGIVTIRAATEAKLVGIGRMCHSQPASLTRIGAT